MLALGLIIGVVLGFVLGVIAVRRWIHVERGKALEMMAMLIKAQGKPDQPSVVHMPSLSMGCAQQWDFVVICGGSNGSEA